MGRARVLVLGGGVAGTVVANRVARGGRRVDVTLVDSHGNHLFQPGLVDVALGRRRPVDLERPERGLLDRRVRLAVGRVDAIDPARRRVRLETREEHPYDALVVATGAGVDTRAIEGFREGAFHFHCRGRAPHVAEALAAFTGGRIVVGAARLPYKCPPSVLSFALLLEEQLRRDGRRKRTEITYVYPVAGVQPSPAVSAALEPLLRERGIEVCSPFPVASVEPTSRTLVSTDGRAIPYDLLVLAPPHRGSPLLGEAGLTGPSGFVRADPETLRAGDRLYALGDAAEVGRAGEPPVPKSGAAARRQAAVVARNVLDEMALRTPSARYDGGATCLAATGAGRALRIELRYGAPPRVSPPGLLNRLLLELVDRLYFPLIAHA